MRWVFLVVVISSLLLGYGISDAAPDCSRSPNAKACRPVPPPPSVFVARTAVIVPSDYAGPLDVNWAADQVQSWLEYTVQTLGERSGGHFLRSEPVTLLRSQYTQAEINKGEVDPCGDGLNWNQIVVNVALELGWNLNAPHRHFYVVLTGGGYAGGAYSTADDTGRSVLGDWELLWQSGNASPCDPWPGVEMSGHWVFCHEASHALGITLTHEHEICGPNDTMLQQQVQDYLSNNVRFLE